MNEKFRFINASQDAGVIRDDSFTGFFGEAITQSNFEESVLTMDKLQEIMKLISTPAATRNPFLDAFDFKPDFRSLVDENQKPDHIHQTFSFMTLPADRSAFISGMI